MNGILVLDRADALGQDTVGQQPTVLSWIQYPNAPAGGGPSALWLEHECSMDGAVAQAHPPLGGEVAAEQAFARLVPRVIDQATELCEATDLLVLGNRLRRLYPRRCPIGVAELTERREALAPSERGATRGLASSRSPSVPAGTS